MAHEVVGGCKCGLVRYIGTLADAPMLRCHCRDCQQLTGTGHAEMVPLEADVFKISDVCSIYAMIGASGQSTYSGFCPNCGSQLTRKAEIAPNWVFIHAASLDDPTIYVPAKSIHSGAAQPWDGAVVEWSGQGLKGNN